LPLAAGPAGKLWQAQLRHYQPLITQIIAQTERWVLAGEAVPAGEKLVSLFEPHADIIVKGSRDVDYGHKLNLTTGRSGLILTPSSLHAAAFWHSSLQNRLARCDRHERSAVGARSRPAQVGQNIG
jgi:hypothetical protein